MDNAYLSIFLWQTASLPGVEHVPHFAFPPGMSWKDFVDDRIGSMPRNPTIANVCSEVYSRECELKD